MNSVSYLLGLLSAVVVLAAVVELLRRRHLRGKYALLYLLLGLSAVVLAGVPALVSTLADVFGVEVPANLLFFGALVVLLLLSLQLAYESGRLEEETRTLAEEVGLLRLETDRLRSYLEAPSSDTGSSGAA